MYRFVGSVDGNVANARLFCIVVGTLAPFLSKIESRIKRQTKLKGRNNIFVFSTILSFLYALSSTFCFQLIEYSLFLAKCIYFLKLNEYKI